jgi:hypothetical protein
MGLAALLIVLGVIIWLLVNPLLGIILLVLGLVMLVWAGGSFRGGYSGRSRVYY